jgi:hypothetical protein
MVRLIRRTLFRFNCFLSLCINTVRLKEHGRPTTSKAQSHRFGEELWNRCTPLSSSSNLQSAPWILKRGFVVAGFMPAFKFIAHFFERGRKAGALQSHTLDSQDKSVKADFTTAEPGECGKFLQVVCSASSLGRRPTVGPQTLDLLIGVRIPASQFDLPKSGQCGATLSQFQPRWRAPTFRFLSLAEFRFRWQHHAFFRLDSVAA